MTLQPPTPNIEPSPKAKLDAAELREIMAAIQGNQDFLCQQFPISAGNLAAVATVVTSLPTANLFVGKQVIYKAAAGIYWNLVYTKESAEYPWNKIGGPPLYATGEGGSNSTETYAATGSPSITLPAVKADVIIDVGATTFNATVNAYSQTGLKIGGAATEDFLSHHQPGAGGASQHGAEANSTRRTLAASTTVKTEIRQIAGGTAQVFQMWLRIDPVRVG